MGLWTYNYFRIITDKRLPKDYFGMAYKDPEVSTEKELEDLIAQWEHIVAHEDEYLPIGEGETLQYKHQNKEIGYTFVGKPMTGYETVFSGSTPDAASEENMLWFVNKCKKVREETGAEILFMHAKCDSDLNGLFEYKHESIGCDEPFEYLCIKNGEAKHV